MTGNRWEALTVFCHFPPKHPESFALADNAGRAEESRQPNIVNNKQQETQREGR